MPQSLVTVPVHIVFSTKNRRPLIVPALRHRLISFLLDAASRRGVESIRINCVEDHVHLLVYLPATLALSEFVGGLKANSSHWLKTVIPGFRWQDGYGAFGVCRTHVDIVARYIDRQQEHHAKPRTKSPTKEGDASLESRAEALDGAAILERTPCRRRGRDPGTDSGQDDRFCW